MTVKTLAARGATNSHVAQLLGVTEGAVRQTCQQLQLADRVEVANLLEGKRRGRSDKMYV